MLEIQYKHFETTNKNYHTALLSAQYASEKIKNFIASDSIPYKIFDLKNSRKQIEECKQLVKQIQNNYSNIIVIAMGGSILNPQTLINLCNNKTSNIKIHFLCSTDPYYCQNLLDSLPLKDCAVLAISNSGQTLETNALVGVLINAFTQHNIQDIGSRFFFITTQNSSIMRNIADTLSATIIPHQESISGRFSGLTNVSTFIAAIAGVDVEEYITGAEQTLERFLYNQHDNNQITAAASIVSMQKPIIVNIGYLQQFAAFLEWSSQIIAESLGKDGIGITPIHGLGPNDQHSMLQLYLDGPTDKLYSLFYIQNIDHPLGTSSLDQLNYISSKKLDSIHTANFQATKIALETRQRPTRSIILQDLSAKTIGALITHSMLETIILSYMLKVNPFDQPGVELIKVGATKLL